MTLNDYETELLLSPLYVANPVFLRGIGWRAEGSGHILIDRTTNGNAVACIIGRVSDQRFNCGPEGNFFNDKYGPLSRAKFEIQLAKPHNTPFAADFDKALDNLTKTQAQVAVTPERRNLIVADGRSKNVRFTRNMFEKRVSTLHI